MSAMPDSLSPSFEITRSGTKLFRNLLIDKQPVLITEMINKYYIQRTVAVYASAKTNVNDCVRLLFVLFN